ncbi:glycosyltransferase family 4 protein [Sphingobacterium gobiense]|uniref:Glycosyltransferase n=1 Tax=Sphingobacterium gobiense TaxID=1382456 RepID=A0A2S9JTK9_9SPHI|nr:glycosyltransferase family 1 protein [Sphingobacterium gobiense]PRD56481.1 glycosyltransferase [Sphingobacterium gobiense]
MKTIVVSAVNIVEAGPLTILRDCLGAWSAWLEEHPDTYKFIAIVHQRSLVDFPHIEYIETQWPKQCWVNRLWYEYVSLKQVSKNIGSVDLWFSLHDTTPNVIAERQVVYCHNALFAYKWKWEDFLFAPKMTLLAMLTPFIYKPYIRRNRYLVVQQAWLGEAMSALFKMSPEKFIVAPPMLLQRIEDPEIGKTIMQPVRSFIYPASPNKHKNFEMICRALEIVEKQYNIQDIRVYITVGGDENKYAKWLRRKWGQLRALHFIGFLSKKELADYYRRCDVLIYPSKAESWGLPISEFAAFRKPMLLADLPYARETSAGSAQVSFFDPDKPEALAGLIKELYEGNMNRLNAVEERPIAEPTASNWNNLFSYLLPEHVHNNNDIL